MTLSERIEVLGKLGDYIAADGDYLRAVMTRTEFNNKWFTQDFQRQALTAIAENFLTRDKLKTWTADYPIADGHTGRKVGLILAGNIPLVGFHDVLCVFAAGHRVQIKLSDKDKYLLPHLLDKLSEFNPAAAQYFEITEKLSGFDAVIATGSNNSARYFEAYFGKYPHIIRKNRTGVAVLTGKETEEELRALGHDIFRYFGLGCRNVSKIYVPQDYDFQMLAETLHEFNFLIHNTKYKNNYDYNIALYQLNKVPLINNGAVIMTENSALISRIATLHYEFYQDKKTLQKKLQSLKKELQLVVSNLEFSNLPVKKFGKAQSPGLHDYADGIDTMAFLTSDSLAGQQTPTTPTRRTNHTPPRR